MLLVSVSIAFGLGLIAQGSEVIAGNSLLERWTEAMRAKQWVTAFVENELIIVKAGGEESIVYRPQPNDVEVHGPIVSPDGTRLAFVKVEGIAGKPYHTIETDKKRKKIYTMAVDGSNLQPLTEMTPPLLAVRGVYMRTSSLAWSHDNRKIVFEDYPRSGFIHLMLFDVALGKTELLAELGPWVEGSGIGPPVIRSQAWAPDNRRVVYMNDKGHATIMDTVTRSMQDVGVGREPTWSPDGRFIAIQMPGERGSRRDGDYLLVSAEPPYERTLLLSNARTLFSFRGLGYAEPAFWFPDDRFLMVRHYPGEQGYPYVLDRTTGDIAKLPPRFWGYSWGGKP